MVQTLFVGVIVLAATLYSVWILLPATVRPAFASRLAALARKFGVGKHRTEQLQQRLAKGGGCGACDGCHGCAVPTGRSEAPVTAGDYQQRTPREQ
jgi:hypothetical protein